jgi:hypothetical protein
VDKSLRGVRISIHAPPTRAILRPVSSPGRGWRPVWPRQGLFRSAPIYSLPLWRRTLLRWDVKFRPRRRPPRLSHRPPPGAPCMCLQGASLGALHLRRWAAKLGCVEGLGASHLALQASRAGNWALFLRLLNGQVFSHAEETACLAAAAAAFACFEESFAANV